MDSHTERRLVTCLFIDVVGSTDATMRLGPERMQRRLADAFAQMSATISEHGGTVEKYIGDAIFALFGAPVAHVDDPERALRAAEACARWSSTGSESEARLAIRVGIESGEALVDLGAVDQRQRMAVGPCVSIAARLQQQADPAEIVVGRTCHEATAHVARYEPLGTVGLKGLGNVEAWRFIAFAAADGAAQVAFVGRDAELERLEDAAERARRGTATLALIVGPPGQGKSRLAAEAIRRAGATGAARLLVVRCRPGTESGANTPLRQLLSADVPDPDPERVRVRLSALLGEDAAAVSAAICHSSGLAPDERLLAFSRLEQRELIAGAWRRYLAALAGQQPLIASIEDLHWSDPVLLRIIDEVTTDLDAPILILATARPEFAGSAHLRVRDDRLQIDLEPLDAETAARLARTVGNGAGGLERAAGNPLFIIELARSRSTDAELPLTIQAAIAARLDELSQDERELLQRASVAGEAFDVRDAALLDDREPAEVAGMLGRIAHLGFIAPIGSSHRFHHALVRDVAYGRLPVVERMRLHARYGEEGVDPSDVEARAHHLWEAVKPDDAPWVWEEAAVLASLRRKAFAAQIAAGERLEERNQYEAAAGVYERAVELASDPAEESTASAHAGFAYARHGRGDEAWQHRLRALDALERAGSPAPAELYADMLEIATMNWGYFQDQPDDGDVMRLLDEGERLARASGDDVSLARLLTERAAFTGDVSAAAEIVRFVESEDAVRFGDTAQRMAMIHTWNGEIDRALRLSETVFERLVPGGAAINESEALLWYGLAAFQAGDLERTEALADRATQDAVGRSAHTRQHALGLRSMLFFGRGAWDEVTGTTVELSELVEANPAASFCLIGTGAVGHGAIAEVVAGHPLPTSIDRTAARMVPASPLIQASSLLVPKVMAGDLDDASDAMASYGRDLRLVDRQRLWDVCDLMPAIALTMLEDWDGLGATLARLDEVAANGGRLAGAVAAAVREEQAAAAGGPSPEHGGLHALGFAGISELLRFRPPAG